MKLVRWNLSELFRHNRRFAVMIILTQILGTFAVFFAAGVLYNNQYVLLEDKTTTLRIEIEFIGDAEGQVPSGSDAQEYLEEIYALVDGAIESVDYLETSMTEDGRFVSVATSGTWSDGAWLLDDTIEQTIDYQIYEGRNFSAEDYADECFVAIATGNYTEATVELYGREYSVIGYRQKGKTAAEPVIFYIPPATWKEIPLGSIQINFLRLPTKQEYLSICAILDGAYEDAYIISDYYAGDEDFQALYRTLGIALTGIILAAGWTLIMLYNYVYEKRRRKMTIYALCGCSRMRNMAICLTEVVCLSLPACAAGTALFVGICAVWLEKLYPYIPLLFTGRIIFGLLLLMVLVFIVENAVLAWIRSAVSIKIRIQEE